ncbi:hypothetical protein A3I40_03545 [Candidatus Uhrbacteria bacterium RIFCSPLOWO2_02_FULL_48_12]|uniref:Extradiol ring-cleavage dioxygenase class III enzyme subunit B domain-containing protein n=1 Tax=Candidatus Uhrbacteria bacterium RIFCSPLOWO2_02_FULL_48_12 TaxID=1802407 RepID=A0A1F7VB29_9BACT|nr:MAG: hypothetical protein A3I40_03545 [Candidatus Uhrbacteria bacterium RIFCSPLOWO2_02_FULL_48_12]
MALVFAAIVPHSPLLIPSIGKKNTNNLSKTIEAMQAVTQQLMAAKPETIIILSNHPLNPSSNSKSLTFNIHARYLANFEEFGEYGAGFSMPGDIAMAHHLKHRFDTLREKYPVTISSQEKLDGSISTTLFYLLKSQPNIKLVPINDTIEDDKPEFIIGERLRRPIYQEKTRIALVASLNLSHRLSELSPAGYSAKAKTFDQRVLEAISKKHPLTLARFKKETLLEVKECAVRPLLLLFGIVKNTHYTPEILSYENPFGIGHMVINLKL